MRMKKSIIFYITFGRSMFYRIKKSTEPRLGIQHSVSMSAM